VADAAGRFEIAIWVARIVVGIGERVAVVEEKFHSLNRDRKTQPFTKGDFHVGDADDFAGEVEERAATVARIDLGGGLQIKLASKLTCLGAEDAFGDGALKAKRAADCKDALADGQGGTATATVGLTVNAAPNQPPVANNDSGYSATQNTALTIAASALLANDTDPNGDPLTITGVSSPVNGTVSFNADATGGSLDYTNSNGQTLHGVVTSYRQIDDHRAVFAGTIDAGSPDYTDYHAGTDYFFAKVVDNGSTGDQIAVLANAGYKELPNGAPDISGDYDMSQGAGIVTAGNLAVH